MAIYNLNKEQIVDKSAKLKSIFCPERQFEPQGI